MHRLSFTYPAILVTIRNSSYHTGYETFVKKPGVATTSSERGHTKTVFHNSKCLVG